MHLLCTVRTTRATDFTTYVEVNSFGFHERIYALRAFWTKATESDRYNYRIRYTLSSTLEA